MDLLQKNEEVQPEAQPNILVQFIKNNKGLIIAGIVVVIAIIIGFSSVFDMGKSEEYRGMIQKIEMQTQSMTGNGNK